MMYPVRSRSLSLDTPSLLLTAGITEARQFFLQAMQDFDEKINNFDGRRRKLKVLANEAVKHVSGFCQNEGIDHIERSSGGVSYIEFTPGRGSHLNSYARVAMEQAGVSVVLDPFNLKLFMEDAVGYFCPGDRKILLGLASMTKPHYLHVTRRHELDHAFRAKKLLRGISCPDEGIVTIHGEKSVDCNKSNSYAFEEGPIYLADVRHTLKEISAMLAAGLPVEEEKLDFIQDFTKCSESLLFNVSTAQSALESMSNEPVFKRGLGYFLEDGHLWAQFQCNDNEGKKLIIERPLLGSKGYGDPNNLRLLESKLQRQIDASKSDFLRLMEYKPLADAFAVLQDPVQIAQVIHLFHSEAPGPAKVLIKGFVEAEALKKAEPDTLASRASAGN